MLTTVLQYAAGPAAGSVIVAVIGWLALRPKNRAEAAQIWGAINAEAMGDMASQLDLLKGQVADLLALFHQVLDDLDEDDKQVRTDQIRADLRDIDRRKAAS